MTAVEPDRSQFQVVSLTGRLTTSPETLAINGVAGCPAPPVARAKTERLSPAAERVGGMHGGRLPLRQPAFRNASNPDEVPRIGREFAYLAIRAPEYPQPSRSGRRIS